MKSKSGANGTPCGQVDSAETVQFKPGTTIGSRTFSGVRLDLEITGNAVAKLTLVARHDERRLPAPDRHEHRGRTVERAGLRHARCRTR